MKALIQIDTTSNRPKYQQILDAVIASIEKGGLEKGQQLPSISELADWQKVAKVTVAKAYEELRRRGVILSQHGKGFYVASTDVRTDLNIFLLFDTLNAYKETLYYALKETLPENARLSLFFHHYDKSVFASLLANHLGKYNCYVVMPHFNEDVADVISQIPNDKLVIIDKEIASLEMEHAAVYQNFEQDIFNGLAAGIDLLLSYRRLTLVLSKNHFQFVPEDIIVGFKRFAEAYAIECAIADTFTPALIQPGEAYLLFADHDLIRCIKQVHQCGWTLGKDIGLISYDDTPMKEILEGGITVISTDFEQMGRTAGRLITARSREKQANPSRLIRRKSL
jgi:DNA-binding transcriptional regulator YhcF (GntR family)